MGYDDFIDKFFFCCNKWIGKVVFVIFCLFCDFFGIV